MSKEEFFHLLQRSKLFHKLKKEELEELLPFVLQKDFEQGAEVFKEGELSRELFVIVSGRAEVVREDIEEGQTYELEMLHVGDYFGEMAHLEDEPRSATVRAVEPLQILSIDLDRLKETPKKEKVYSEIIASLAKHVSSRLRKTDDTLIDSLKEKLKATQILSQTSRLLVQLFILAALWFNISKFIQLFPIQRPFLEPIAYSLLFVVFAASAAYVIKASGLPLKFYGITGEKWFRHTVEAVVFSLPVIVFLFFLKWIFISEFEIFRGVSLFSWPDIKEFFRHNWLLAVVYVIFVPIQELAARGVTQSLLRRFFQGPNRVFLAILMANLIFQLLHTVKDFWLAFSTFFLGILWGVLFEQQKSLVGVCVSHALIGFVGLYVFNYLELIRLAGT